MRKIRMLISLALSTSGNPREKQMRRSQEASYRIVHIGGHQAKLRKGATWWYIVYKIGKRAWGNWRASTSVKPCDC